MGVLIACVLAIAAGALIGAVLGARSTRQLAGEGRERIARTAVLVLGGAAGALVAAQLDLLVRALELDARISRSFGVAPLRGRFETLAFTEAFRDILLYGAGLAGLAAIIGSIAAREPRAQRP